MTDTTKPDEILKDHQYMEGTWAAPKMVAMIAKTEYKTLENAIKVKQELIDHFEKEFGYTREMLHEPDRNYSFNYGLLDEMNNILAKQQSENESNEVA